MSNGSWILIDFEVVTAFVRHVTEEMDCYKLCAARFRSLGLQMLQTIYLVPTYGEYIERDLTTN
jgi:hypothetical protein